MVALVTWRWLRVVALAMCYDKRCVGVAMNVVVAEASVEHEPGFEFANLTKVSPAIATSKKKQT